MLPAPKKIFDLNFFLTAALHPVYSGGEERAKVSQMPYPLNLRCGPAGWSYPHWNGVVYPKAKPRGFHALEFLSEVVDTIEVNTTFYRPLRPEVAHVWLHKAAHNPAFLFTAKLNRRFTHERILDADEVKAFKDGLFPLLRAGRLGCLLMQFPWSFRFTGENREYFIRLRRTFHEFPLVAEMRHSSWILDEALGTFIDYRVGFCNLDQPRHLRATPPTAFLTTGIGYIRLHGRGQADWFQDFGETTARVASSDYLYSPAELGDWLPRAQKLAGLADKAFVIFTNDRGGKAMVNALQFRAALGDRRLVAPPNLLARYGRELAGFSPGGPVQPRLFADRAA
jgi:uncharacterized protein YecE (DUF72 family)